MARRMRCPRDGRETEARVLRSGSRSYGVEGCPACGEAWFGRSALARACGDSDLRRRLLAYATGRTELACPRCGRAMAARTVGDASLHVCRTCRGAWADPEALRMAAEGLGEVARDASRSSPGIGTARRDLLGTYEGVSQSTKGFAPSVRRTRRPK